MATVAVAQTTNPTQNRGPRGPGKRGKGKGNRGGRGGGAARPAQGEAPKNDKAGAEATVDKDEEDAQDDAGICWICAEPVKYYAVPECNHQTCHVCSLRLRALYKKNECTFCKEPQPSMVFTASAEAQFSSFDIETMPFKDAKLSVFFETQEMMEETLLLLRFNCPDPACDFIGNGWSDVKLHARATHGRLMCDLCIRHKKVFAHEHTLYQPNILPLHLPSMQSAARPSRPAKGKDKEQIEGGVHPLCEFCRECFFGDDELYKHMRETHEECFICKRNDIRDQYFMNYPALENHFVRDHHPCPHPTCLARKFVVFGSALDLKAHAVEEHGAELGKDELRDARRIEPAWESGGHGRGRGRGQERERPRDRAREGPPPPPPQAPAAGPARPPAGGRRREGFGAQLTIEGESPAPTPARTPSPPRADVDPAVAERHAAFLQRLSALATHPATAVQSARAAIRSFRASESTARGLISTLYSIVDSRMEATSSVVNALVDLFDTPSDAEQREAILGAWRDFEVSQRQQFPDLVPSAVGGGFAGIASGRVLNAKHATATRAGRGGAVLDRVAQAAAQDRFPALSSSLSSVPGAGPRVVPGQRNTPWSGASSSSKPTGFAASSLFVPPPVGGSAPAVVVPRSENVAGSSGGGVNNKAGPPPKLSSALFPELPTRQKTAVQVKGNQSLKNILGQGAAGTGAWGSGSGSGASSGTSTPVVGVASGAAEPTEEDAGLAGGAAAGAGGGKKKGKGKQKQTLFTLGAFPS
ncbi:RING-type domain-containing protein [Mycena chlorophos]|uniref:RING-type E3 ubiquitin transferase n=1 Tax=Mycena chlorophos TaxID=658473 RepID=A0A8H6SX36_MYCCL|nr:RING-type domain-containing protein [Mycena chlorophos]